MNNNTTRISAPYPLHQMEIYISAVYISGVLGFVGIFGNLLVLCVYKGKRQKSTTDIFIIALSFIDILGSVYVIPTCIYAEVAGFPTSGGFCIGYYYPFYFVFGMSVCILFEIALDRYCAICHPHHRFINKKRAKYIVIGSLLFIAYLSIVPTISCVCSGAIYETVADVFMSVMVIFVLLFMIFFYISIFLTVFNQSRNRTSYRRRGNSELVSLGPATSAVYVSAHDNEITTERLTRSKHSHKELTFTMKECDVVKSDEVGKRNSLDVNTRTTATSCVSTDEASSAAGTPRVARRKEVQSLQLRNRLTTRKRRRFGRQSKTVVMLLIVTATFILSYAPGVVMIFSVLFKWHWAAREIILYLVNTYHVSYAVNPVIYAIMSKQFREECHHVFRRTERFCKANRFFN